MPISYAFFIVFSLIVGAIFVYKIALEILNNRIFAFFSSILTLILPFINYKLFYLHADLYDNFVSIILIWACMLYIYKYLKTENTKNLGISIIFLSAAALIHLYIAFISLILLSLIILLNKKNCINKKIKILGILSLCSFIVISGYLIVAPILQKLLAVFNITQNKFSEAYSPHLINWDDFLNLITPIGFILRILLAFYFVLNKENQSIREKIFPINLFCTILILFIILFKFSLTNLVGLKMDLLLILGLPFIISLTITKNKINILNKSMSLLLIFILVITFIINSVNILNGFSLDEINSVSTALNSNGCKITASQFRISSWVPFLSNSIVYYASADPFFSHSDKLDDVSKMLSSKFLNQSQRYDFAKEKKVDCFIYMKNSLIVDGYGFKGTAKNNYETLEDKNKFEVGYEDTNTILIKIK